MTRIYAELDRMDKESRELITKEERYTSIRKKMENIVDVLKKVWQGTDADTFYSHAESYLNSLINVENTMIYFSNKMNRKTKKYSSAYDEYKDRIRKFESTIGDNTVSYTHNSLEIGEKE